MKIIDWEQAIKLAGNKPEVAEELLSLFIKTLPEEVLAIQHAYKKKDYPNLLKKIHKVHGATCYCGVPRLKQAASNLEECIKKNEIDQAEFLLNVFLEEKRLLLAEWAASFRSQ